MKTWIAKKDFGEKFGIITIGTLTLNGDIWRFEYVDGLEDTGIKLRMLLIPGIAHETVYEKSRGPCIFIR